MRQDHLFDRSPLADLWEREPEAQPPARQVQQPEITPGPVVIAKAAEARACRERKAREEQAGHCLKCDKLLPAGQVFCSAKCKRAWSANMNRWHAGLARTREPQGAQELFG